MYRMTCIMWLLYMYQSTSLGLADKNKIKKSIENSQESIQCERTRNNLPQLNSSELSAQSGLLSQRRRASMQSPLSQRNSWEEQRLGGAVNIERVAFITSKKYLHMADIFHWSNRIEY